MSPSFKTSPLARALAGAAALALSMGIGRFAYTALLPSVRAGLGFDAAQGGAIASANLTGYLAGALCARQTPGGVPRAMLIRLGLLLSVATTGAVVFFPGPYSFGLLRFLGGVASGLVFVLVSASVLEVLPVGDAGHAGIHYSGIGVGIALAGTLAALMPRAPWQTPWLLLCALAGVLALPAFFMAPGEAVSPPVPSRGEVSEFSLPLLSLVYFLEGLGYIVSGTFAVTAVQHNKGLERWASWVWVASGLAAAPSAILWNRLSRRFGQGRALVLAYALQAVGMALPALSPSRSAALVGAIFFGGTFVGIVTVLLDLGQHVSPVSASQTIGTLTVVYGVGQVLGPILAGWVTRATGDPSPAVVGAAAAVGTGAVLLAARLSPGTRRHPVS